MKEMTWIKTEWNGNSATFTLAPAGSEVINTYRTQNGLIGERMIIPPAGTSTGENRRVWRHLKDAMRKAWHDGSALYAAHWDKGSHPIKWEGNVVADARVITREYLEEILHFSEPYKGSKLITDWRMFWAWVTRPANHPKEAPLTLAAPGFVPKLFASQTTGVYYEQPNSRVKVFPLNSGINLYWDGGSGCALIARGRPDLA